MKNSMILFFIVCALAPGLLAAQTTNIPAAPQPGAILIKGATAHLGNGQVIDNAIIAFDQGKLTIVGDANTAVNESEFEVIDASNKHIYPGFILTTTNLGLVETGSTEDTRDYSETGSNNASVRSIIAYNTDSELIPTMRFMGVLMAQATPSGGTIKGNSSIVQLDAWNWEDAAYKTDDGIHMEWPLKKLQPRWWMDETSTRPNPNYQKAVNLIKSAFADAKAYGDNNTGQAINLKLQALQGLFDGTKTLYIEADDAKAILESCRFAKEVGVQKNRGRRWGERRSLLLIF